MSKGKSVQEEHWIPLTDLMTGLMMLFMLVALLFMIQVQAQAKKIEADAKSAEQQATKVKKIASVYDEIRASIFQDLRSEFEKDLPTWDAELTRDLTIRFKAPEVLFDVGKDSLKKRFTDILDDFFPRYVRILTKDGYSSSVDEVRIEGHTSSVWNSQVSPDQAYFLNMELSQSRTRTVLRYVASLPGVAVKRPWLRTHLTANGLSSSRPIMRPDGTENRDASQRVEFRIKTNADEKLEEILRQ
jgi:outer membrane protein OmpA-like peptidoglycan-associated protein